MSFMIFSSQIARSQPMVFTLVGAPTTSRFRDIDPPPVLEMRSEQPGESRAESEPFHDDTDLERWDGMS